jgi:hypothetical protein
MAVTVPGDTVGAIPVQVGPGGHVAPAVVVREGIGHGAQGSRRLADAGREPGLYNFVVDHPATVAPPGKILEKFQEQVVSAVHPTGYVVDPAVVIQVGLLNGGFDR